MLAPPLSRAVLETARDFAHGSRTLGVELTDDWLNNGPASLASVLPSGWEDRTQPLFAGRALLLRTLGRLDLLRSKLFALCDRGLDLADCFALAPTVEELVSLRSWLDYQDASPDWPAHVGLVLADLEQRQKEVGGGV